MAPSPFARESGVRRPLATLGVVCCLGLAAGCGPSSKPDLVWGKRGVLDGDMVRPRAAVIDGDDRLWIVDFTARIQAYDLDGNYLGPTFTPPDFRNGRPSGLGVTRDGKLIVCDSHYSCIRIYEPDGTEVKKIGGEIQEYLEILSSRVRIIDIITDICNLTVL